MINKLYFIFLIIFIMSPVVSLFAQLNAELHKDSVYITNEYITEQVGKGKQYTLVLLKRGLATKQNQKQLMNHLHHLFTLKAEGKLLLAGPLNEDSELRGICIYDLTDKEEVKKLVEEDPAVKSGRLSYEIYEWFGIPGDGLPEN